MYHIMPSQIRTTHSLSKIVHISVKFSGGFPDFVVSFSSQWISGVISTRIICTSWCISFSSTSSEFPYECDTRSPHKKHFRCDLCPLPGSGWTRAPTCLFVAQLLTAKVKHVQSIMWWRVCCISGFWWRVKLPFCEKANNTIPSFLTFIYLHRSLRIEFIISFNFCDTGLSSSSNLHWKEKLTSKFS